MTLNARLIAFWLNHATDQEPANPLAHLLIAFWGPIKRPIKTLQGSQKSLLFRSRADAHAPLKGGARILEAAATAVTLLLVTTRAASDGTGTRARARTDRAVRCGAVKSETGHPCRRAAGAGTDHPGVGPCANHDDGSWRRPAFADNVEAQQAFLAAVREQRRTRPSIREVIEPLGYARRDVTALIDSDPGFQDDYVEARGYDPDRVRSEIADRAFDRKDPASARLLELEAKMLLPEGQALSSRMRVDGRLEVQAMPMIDPSLGTIEELQQLRELLVKFSPAAESLPPGQKPAGELLPADDVR